MDSKTTILVLAPHTDDGELGCGATLAKYAVLDYSVVYVAFSTCRESLPEGYPSDTLVHECTGATRTLGIPSANVQFHDFPVRRFTEHRQAILEVLVQLRNTYQPHTVFLPAAGDIHQDHQVIHDEGRRAFKFANLLGYELPWNNTRFSPTLFETISSAHLQTKITAVQCYHSQQHRTYTQPGFLESLAKVRGVQSNTPLAEAFEVYHYRR